MLFQTEVSKHSYWSVCFFQMSYIQVNLRSELCWYFTPPTQKMQRTWDSFFLSDETLPHEAVVFTSPHTSPICIYPYFSFYQLFPEEILLEKLWYPLITLFLHPATHYQSQLPAHYSICRKALFEHVCTALQVPLLGWRNKPAKL